MTTVINIFAGPSAGKSTNAAGLFHWMKDKRYNVELATEFAKDVVWSGDKTALDDQFYLFGNMHHRIYKLVNQVDYVITDCPLLMNIVYMNDRTSLSKYQRSDTSSVREAFSRAVLYAHYQYNNYNYFIDRGDRKFVQAGRVQNLEKSIEKDREILDMLNKNNITWRRIKSYQDIIDDIIGVDTQ